MLWLINEKSYQTNELKQLKAAILSNNSEYQPCNVIPFLGDILVDNQEINLERKDVICFGSYEMRNTAIKQQWNPGVYDLESVSFKQQFKHWGSELLNFDALICAIPFAPTVKHDVFVRPADKKKMFPGQVISSEHFDEWKNKIVQIDSAFYEPKNQLIQISRVREISKEYRLWVVDGQIVASSQHKQNHQLVKEGSPKEVQRYVEKRLKTWMPAQAFVIDVCETPEGLKIIDINSINNSEFYGADIVDIVAAISKSFEFI